VFLVGGYRNLKTFFVYILKFLKLRLFSLGLFWRTSGSGREDSFGLEILDCRSIDGFDVAVVAEHRFEPDSVDDSSSTQRENFQHTEQWRY
jgi:hypothetical protein